MTACVIAAVLGMLSVLWYTMGVIDEKEAEREEREEMERKDRKAAEGGKRFFGLRMRKAGD